MISRGLDTAPVRAGIDVLWWVLPPSTPCLLFEQTKQLFQRWLFYGIGTMFSMAVKASVLVPDPTGLCARQFGVR
ncbi:type IV secretion system protein [Stenotrophomonas maltophilia]|nr:type IV secretion system protein [Stenotrophomonas maltophilia]UGB15573.1 type IV secretion system protein [Stenotrophomonas maltophilia]